MPRISQPVLVGTEDPEYYAELLSKTYRLANRRLLSNETLCSDIPSIQDVDGSLSQCLRRILDVIADISLCKRGNVSATMACVKANKDALETQVYITFNHKNDGAASSCPIHLQSIFDMLSRVPYRSHGVDSSPKDISSELEGSLFEICRTIHNYSFDIFAYRVNKRKHKLSDIWKYIEQDGGEFDLRQRTLLLNFLSHVGTIIEVVANAQTTKQLSSNFICGLVRMYSIWTKNGLLPKEGLASNVVTLLDRADAWLAATHGIGFWLRRWAVKIMSFVISADRLFILTQSRRLRKFLDGTFVIKPLPCPTTTPYRCNLSSENIRVALDAALHQTKYSTAEWDEERESPIALLHDKLRRTTGNPRSTLS
ncbi:uncharacterized protein EI90DRAFT_3018263 [Cantharellus anzutake]|uniref:uncharacterized protein n=1 Tax=Cantharellus anzutake TaxID=1750568 RepID=UPI001903D833|nr:uncharacterized protein EI90DRAFT_3018263 [Cantharellus anzutake]KAF8327194.1 hypothetical protein EI90DRAFT_3018263 [Cantharellus anzutake]